MVVLGLPKHAGLAGEEDAQMIGFLILALVVALTLVASLQPTGTPLANG